MQVRCKSGVVPPAVIPLFRESQNAEYANSSAGKEVGDETSAVSNPPLCTRGIFFFPANSGIIK